MGVCNPTPVSNGEGMLVTRKIRILKGKLTFYITDEIPTSRKTRSEGFGSEKEAGEGQGGKAVKDELGGEDEEVTELRRGKDLLHGEYLLNHVLATIYNMDS